MVCKGCGREMHKSVADASRQAIAVLVGREGHRPAGVPNEWRKGPLCCKCQAAWSAAISELAAGPATRRQRRD
jgi:hypothetical protein